MGAFRGELIINLGAIQKNYEILDGMSGAACETAVCVKADAYGLGAFSVAPAFQNVGANRFFVATVDEGIALRGVLPEAHIYIFNGFSYQKRQIYQEYNLIPVLNALQEIHEYRNFAREIEEKLRGIVHFDTGINRLGLRQKDAEILCADMSIVDGIEVDFVMSHFACADEKDNPANQEQFEKFTSWTSCFNDVKRSLCNSGGIFLSPDYHMDLTRPGIALYGGRPVNDIGNIMQQVVTLSAPILQIYDVKKGERAGYGGTYCFEKDTRIALISIGYADGFLRYLGNTGSLYWQGYKMPIRGRVSMDLLICDLCELPEQHYPNVSDKVEVIGPHQSIDDLAKDAKTISYEILTSFGSRYKRLYIA